MVCQQLYDSGFIKNLHPPLTSPLKQRQSQGKPPVKVRIGLVFTEKGSAYRMSRRMFYQKVAVNIFKLYAMFLKKWKYSFGLFNKEPYKFSVIYSSTRIQ